MAILADWTQIVGDASVTIGAVTGVNAVPVPLNGTAFDTSGREENQTALLMFSVRDLLGSARVLINGHEVGTITSSVPGYWSTQMISVSGSQLRSGGNFLVMKDVSDQFSIKNLMCFFHQVS